MKKVLLVLSAAILLSSNAFACTKHLKVTKAWARSSTSPNNNSAAYMEINNTSDKDMEITGAESEVAERVELHETYLDDKGVSNMRHVDKIVVPAHSKIEMKPKHTHIMLMDLKHNLKAGQKFKIKLNIGEKDSKNVEVEVKPLGK